ncbi:MAG: hypothetical protein H0W39_11960, partial [Sphingomonas sp.]|nr:hypothetical protein [Sphingomonas sp.]
PKPKRRSRKKASEPVNEEAAPETGEPGPVPAADDESNGDETSGELRRGWWQRTFG